jgi:hypothetical protein
MDCWTVQRGISACLDSAGFERERCEIIQHLSDCRTCAAEAEKHRRVREALRSLPQRTPPPDLAVRLRVAASKARAQTGACGPAAGQGWRDRFQLFRSNLMRPLALPTMGGLCSAVFLFSTLVPTFKSAFVLDKNPWDVPTMLTTEPTLKFTAPVASFYGDAVVDLQLDRQGHIVNYSIVGAPGQTTDQVRRNLENSLLFTEFWPATNFGRPVTGTVRISFRSSHIDVRG